MYPIHDHVIPCIHDHVIPYIHDHVISSYTAPSEPTNLTAVALSHSRVRVMWGPVTDNGGAQVNQYKLVVTGPAGLSSPDPRDFPPEENEYIITGLVNNTNYL